MQAHAVGRRQLGVDTVAQQARAVVARAGHLVGMAEVGPEARLRLILRSAGVGHLADDGHHRHVEQVADAGTRKVGVRESDDRRVGLMVSRAPVPILRDARGSDLHQAERDVGPDEDVSVTARPDLRIDPAGQVLRLGGRLCAGAGKGCETRA